MVLEPQIFDYLDGDLCVFEKDPMKKLAEQGSLCHIRTRAFGSAWIINERWMSLRNF